MAAQPGFVQVTPFLGVSDIVSSIAFYTDILGFACFVSEGGYAYLERDRIAIRLLELDDCAPHPAGASHSYVDLLDVDAVFAAFESNLATLPKDRWGSPKDQPHGQREFWVRDPDGNLLTFGQGIGDNAKQWDYRR